MKPRGVHLESHSSGTLPYSNSEQSHDIARACQQFEEFWVLWVGTRQNRASKGARYTLLPRPCPPQGWSLWWWWLTGFYTNTGRENPGKCLYTEEVSRFPGWPQGALPWAGTQSGESQVECGALGSCCCSSNVPGSTPRALHISRRMVSSSCLSENAVYMKKDFPWSSSDLPVVMTYLYAYKEPVSNKDTCRKPAGMVSP